MTFNNIETAWALSKGTRITQEDALHLWFEPDARSGYIIVADGMGGHTSGDIASSLAVEAVDDSLNSLWKQRNRFEHDIFNHLPALLNSANMRLARYIETSPETAGMGTTLLTVIILEDRLYWASVGDSPLYLFRDDKLVQLNEDHSMARQIDQMVHAGQLTRKAALEHPDRNALTSVLMGDAIANMDCRVTPLALCTGDILIAATDGILSLPSKELAQCITSTDQTADMIVASITSAIDAQACTDQDNLAICVTRIL